MIEYYLKLIVLYVVCAIALAYVFSGQPTKEEDESDDR